MQYNPQTGEPIIDPTLSHAWNQSLNQDANQNFGMAYGPHLRTPYQHGPEAPRFSQQQIASDPLNRFSQTPQGQQYGQQVDEWSKWDTAHGGDFLTSVLHGLGNMPIIGGVVKGASELLSRPGDLVNNPIKYLGAAAQTAAPFMGATLGAQGAKLLGLGGGLASSGAYKNPGSLLPSIPGIAGGVIGGDGGNALKYGGMAYNALNARPPGGRSMPPTSQPPNPWSTPTTGPSTGTRAADNPLGFLGGSNTGNQLAGLYGLATSGNNNQPLPQLSNMGVLSNEQGVMGNMASNAGVANPFTGQGGQSDPYSLMPHEQEAFNTTANMVNQGRQASIAGLRQRMSAMGINDPRAIQVAEAAINSGHDQMLADTHSNLMNQAFANRQSTLSQFSQQIPQLYNQQFATQQTNIGNQRYNQNQVGANLGMIFGNQQNPYLQYLKMMQGGQGGGMPSGYPGGNGGFDQGVQLDQNGFPINAQNAPNYGLPGEGPWMPGQSNQFGMPGSQDLGGGMYGAPDFGIPQEMSWSDYGIPGMDF